MFSFFMFFFIWVFNPSLDWKTSEQFLGEQNAQSVAFFSENNIQKGLKMDLEALLNTGHIEVALRLYTNH